MGKLEVGVGVGKRVVWRDLKMGLCKWDRAVRPFVCMRLGFGAFLSTRLRTSEHWI